MRTGRMRTRLAFMSLTETPDGGGGTVKAWAPGDPIMCGFKPIPASKAITAESVEQMRRATATIRASAAPSITAETRVLVKGKEYAVMSATDHDDKGRYLVMILEGQGV